MTNPQPWMTQEEIDLLARTVRPWHRVWEWGSGGSTLWLASRCKAVTSVEHNAFYAARAVMNAPRNVSVLYVPPDGPYEEGGLDDGDLTSFRSYVETANYNSDVYVVDGRARTECCKYVRERALVGPSDKTLIFVHDFSRYVEFFDGYPLLEVVERAGELALLKVRWE